MIICDICNNSMQEYPNTLRVCGRTAVCRKERSRRRYLKESAKSKAYRQQYYQDNKERIKADMKVRAAADPRKRLRGHAKERATSKSLPFALELEDIVLPEYCPILGVKLIYGTKRSDASPSLDQIIPGVGYTRDNVQVLSDKANRMKNDATPEELRMFAKYYLKECKCQRT
jgi:hypothetical protein